MSGLRRALVALAVAGFAFGWSRSCLTSPTDEEETTTPFIVLALTLGWGVHRRGPARLVAPAGAPDRAR